MKQTEQYEARKWIGKKFKCVYGLNQDNVFTVTSEPYSIDMRGTKAVNGFFRDAGWYIGDDRLATIEVEELEGPIYWKEIKNPKRRKKANLKKEISTRFEKAAEMVSTDAQPDELDFFLDLLYDGITLDDIKIYCPEKYEYSRDFMENHGLTFDFDAED